MKNGEVWAVRQLNDQFYWYYIENYVHRYTVRCMVWRPDGTAYRSAVTECYLRRGHKVFNHARLKDPFGLPLVWA